MVVLVCSAFIAGASGPSCDLPKDRTSVLDSNDRDRDDDLERWRRRQAVADVFKKSMSQPKSPVPIVYDDRLGPWPLVQSQVNRILRRGAAVCPEGRDIWFILVRNNYVCPVCHWRLCCYVTIYFTPDVSEPRIRKGRCTWYSDSDPHPKRSLDWLLTTLDGDQRRDLEPLLRKTSERPKRPAVPPESIRVCGWYRQVSFRNKPFTEQLHAPVKTLWPFWPPIGFTDEEVIEIIDFLRTSPKVAHPPNVIRSPDRFDGSAPILSIKRAGEGIVVRSGTQQGFLAGSGEEILLKRKGSSFVVVSIGMWVS